MHIVSGTPQTKDDSASLQLDEAIEKGFVGKGNKLSYVVMNPIVMEKTFVYIYIYFFFAVETPLKINHDMACALHCFVC